MNTSNLKSILTFLIGWPLSLVAIYFIYSRVSAEKDVVLKNIANINIPFLIIGILCFVTYYYVRSYIWFKLLGYFASPMTYKESTSLWAVTSLKRYIPGNIWSYLGMTVLLGKKGLERKHILQAILFEQQIVIIGCTLIALLSLPYLATYIFPEYAFLLSLSVPLAILGTFVFIFNRKILTYVHGRVERYLKHFFPDFPPSDSLMLILQTMLSFIILGAGYYFVIISVTFVTPALFLQIVGFVVFALLLGVLSLITPTGLGIREGILAFGFSKIMDVGLAGFVSLFSRIILICSELAFVVTAYLWEKVKHTKLEAGETFLQKHVHALMVLVGIIMYTSYFSLAGFLRYDNFYTGRFDLGNMAQTVWNTLHGNLFMFTDPNGTREVSRLAFHADFLLILLTPFYFLWENPKMLIFIQAFVVGAGALFVYALTRDILKNRILGVILAFCYLFNPAIQWTLLYDFHAVTLATTFLLGAWYFLIKRNYWLFVVFAILAGITKEQVWFVVALFGLYIAIFHKRFQLGLAIAGVSVLLFYLLIWHIIPSVSGSASHFALEYYKDGGDNPGALIKNTLLNPIDTVIKLTEPERILYIRQLFEPLGYLSILAPLFLIFSVPDFAINLISDKPHLHQIYYQYSAVISPFLFIAAIYGIKNLKQYFPKIPYIAIGIYIIVTTLYGQYYYGPLPGVKQQNINMFTRQQPGKEKIMSVLRSIPATESVSATNNIGAQLSHRKELFVVPIATESADIIAFLFTEETFKDENPDVHVYRNVLSNPNYRISYQDGYFTVLEKKWKTYEIEK